MSDDLPPGFVMGTPDDLPAGFTAGAKRKFGLGDTWPARLAKDIYRAVTLPGDVAQGNVSMTGEDGHTNPEVINRSAELAMTMAPGAPKVGMVDQAIKAPTQEALAGAAKAGYKSAQDLGLEISPRAISDLGTGIGSKLVEDGINGKLAPKTFSILEDLAYPPSGSTATLSNVETIRRTLGNAAKDFSNPTEQLAAKRAIGHLDDYLASIPDKDVVRGSASEASSVVGEARGNYGAAKRSERITEALDKADLNAAAANSGQNYGNAARQRIKSILQNDKQSSGFNPDELAAMESVVRGTPVSNTTRILGNLLGGGGGLGSVASAAVGAGSLGPVGATAPALGYALKKISDASVNRQLSKLDNMVRSRSPLAKQLMSGASTGEVPLSRQALARGLLATPMASRQ